MCAPYVFCITGRRRLGRVPFVLRHLRGDDYTQRVPFCLSSFVLRLGARAGFSTGREYRLFLTRRFVFRRVRRHRPPLIGFVRSTNSSSSFNSAATLVYRYLLTRHRPIPAYNGHTADGFSFVHRRRRLHSRVCLLSNNRRHRFRSEWPGVISLSNVRNPSLHRKHLAV